MRRLKVIAILLVLIMIFTGCNLVEINSERDMERVVAKVEGKTITKDEYANAYYYNAQIYTYYYGYSTEDLTTDEMVESLQTNAIESMINQKIMEIKAEEYGCYDFTQEELDEILVEYDSLMETYKEPVKTSLEADDANAGISQEEMDKLIQEGFEAKLEEANIDKDAYLQSLKDQKAVEKLEEIITETDEPTESELLTAYDEKVAEQEAAFVGNAATYKSYLDNGYTIYYNISDIRKTTHILISFPDDIKTELSTLRAEDEDAANALRDEELVNIKDKAEEVYALALEGADFKELIAEYGEDPGMETNDYYTVVKEATQFAPEYVEALFALENVGDFTELIASDFGYHIILYYEEVPEGAVAFEDVKESVKEDVLEVKKNDIYQEKLNIWREEAKVKIYKSRLDIDLE